MRSFKGVYLGVIAFLFVFAPVALTQAQGAPPTLPPCGEVSQVATGATLPDAPVAPTVYLRIGDTQQPLIKSLGKALRQSETTPVQLVYVTSGSCTNVEEFFSDNPIRTNAFYIPPEADWDPKEIPPQCTVPEDGQPLDIGNSATFVSSCGLEQPEDVAIIRGGVQAYLFVTHKRSGQTAITAREAYFAFAFGNASKAVPWNDASQMFIRPDTKSSILTPAAAIGLASSLWNGERFDKSREVLSAVTTTPQFDRSIGILGAQIYDDNRDQDLKTLAFRSFGQDFAYYPDSTLEARDELNVRVGRYTIWSPAEWMIRTQESGDADNATAAFVTGLLTGNEVEEDPGFEPLDTIIAMGQIPDCAMEVTREFDGALLSLYRPEAPCSCYYEAQTGSTSCASCDEDNPCASGTCRRGYCEVR